MLVVIVDHKDKAKNIYGTVTHNRARGTHLLEPMKKIVKELMDEGKTVEEIGKTAWNETGGDLPIVRFFKRRLLEDDDKRGDGLFKS